MAFRGWDLALLWRQRRWRFVLNLIEHLPRDSSFAEAVAEDDELADETVKRLDGKRRPPPISEFGPEVEALRDIYDRLGHLIHATVAVAGAKRPPKPKPALRPVTAIDRAKRRRTKQAAAEIIAKATPREVGPDT